MSENHTQAFAEAVKALTDELTSLSGQYRHMAQLFSCVADCVPGLVWAKNLERRYIFGNKRFREWLGAEPGEDIEGSDDNYWAERNGALFPEDPDYHTFGIVCQNSDSVTLQSGQPQRFLESGMVRGMMQYLQVDKALLYDTEGVLIGLVGTAFDVTDRIMVQEGVFNEYQKAIEGEMEPKLTKVTQSLRSLFDRHKYTDGTVYALRRRS